jgi:oxygen-dependent protoporphyrinogen oxidase
MRKARTKNQEPRTAELPNGSRFSVLGSTPFVTLRGGVGALVDALVKALDGRLVGGCGVAAIDRDPTAARPYRVRLDDGELLEADALILTAPSFVAADLVAPFGPELAIGLRQIRYVTTATVSLAYPSSDIGKPLDGFGLVIPRSEQRRINAVTVTSSKFVHRAPEGYTLLRVFVGGSRNPRVAELDDITLLELVRDELRATIQIDSAPLWSRIYRWPHSNPQYDVGHLDRIDALEALCPEGLYLSGSAYRGVGIPDCVRQGQAAAEKAIVDLQKTVDA